MSQHTSYDNLTIKFDSFHDERGELTIAQTRNGHKLPFLAERVFWITNVPVGHDRGKHAHRTCWEALVAVKGSFTVKVDNGSDPARSFTLDNPQKGILIPPMLWCELSAFTPDAVCLCMASGNYDQEGYISDYNDFLEAAAHCQ